MEVSSSRPKNLQMLYKIAGLMENKEFRDFFDEHFEYYDDITSIIMIMKAYQGIQNELSISHDPTIDEIVEILHSVMMNKDYRSEMAKRMVLYMSDGKKFYSSREMIKEKKKENNMVITNVYM